MLLLFPNIFLHKLLLPEATCLKLLPSSHALLYYKHFKMGHLLPPPFELPPPLLPLDTLPPCCPWMRHHLCCPWIHPCCWCSHHCSGSHCSKSHCTDAHHPCCPLVPWSHSHCLPCFDPLEEPLPLPLGLACSLL